MFLDAGLFGFDVVLVDLPGERAGFEAGPQRGAVDAALGAPREQVRVGEVTLVGEDLVVHLQNASLPPSANTPMAASAAGRARSWNESGSFFQTMRTFCGP